MKKQLIIIFLSVILLSINCKDNKTLPESKPALPAANETAEDESEYPWIGKVNGTVLNIRSKPELNGEIVDKVQEGHRLDVLSGTNKTETIAGKFSSWYKVKTPSGKEGYAFGGYIEKNNAIMPQKGK